jgi:hypothetical protein
MLREQGLLSALRLMWELFDMDIILFLARDTGMRPDQRDVYFVMERSKLAYTPSLEFIFPHPCVCELLPRRNTFPVPQRG